MAIPSPRDIQESVEKQESILNWLVQVWRSKNYVKILLLSDAVLLAFFNPPVLSKVTHTFGFTLLPWYAPVWISSVVLIFVAAFVVALRSNNRPAPKPTIERRAIKGLRPFAFNDAEIFTRLQRDENLREALVSITSKEFRFGVLSGESGAGKTSFLQAGLWPHLPKHNHRCLYVKLTEADPVESIRQTCIEQKLIPEELPATTRLLEILGSCTRGSSDPLVLLLDQFEQFFVHHKRRSNRKEFVQDLTEWYQNSLSLPVKVLICIRSDFSDRLIELHKSLKYSLGPQESFRLEKFEPKQAATVLKVIAETEDILCDEEFVEGIAEKELASREDGLISPVDVQILAWMIAGQEDEERAFNRATYQRLGGVEGLLERFLKRALDARETETRRQAAVKTLLTLIDLDGNTRLGPLTLNDLKERVKGSIPPAELEEGIEWLARSDIRLVTPMERNGVLVYELAHERLIPALRRLAGQELSAVDRTNQLFNRRVNEWLGNDRASRYLLTWRELRTVNRYKKYLDWGGQRKQKQALLSRSLRHFRLRLAACALALSSSIAVAGWWYSSWGQLWQANRDLLTLSERINDEVALQQLAGTFALTGRLDQADAISRKLSPSDRAKVLIGIAKRQVKVGKSQEALRSLEPIGKESNGIPWLMATDSVVDLASAYTEAGSHDKAAELLKEASKARNWFISGKERVDFLLSLAKAHLKAKRADEVMPFLQQALSESEVLEPEDRVAALVSMVDSYEEIASESGSTSLLQQVTNSTDGLSDENKAWVLATAARVYANLGANEASLGLLDRVRDNADKIVEKGLESYLSNKRRHLTKSRDKVPAGWHVEWNWERGSNEVIISGDDLLLMTDDRISSFSTPDMQRRFYAKAALDSNVRSKIFTPVAAAYARVGKNKKDASFCERAVDASSWLDSKQRRPVLVDIAEALASLGKVEEAEKLSRNILGMFLTEGRMEFNDKVAVLNDLIRINEKILQARKDFPWENSPSPKERGLSYIMFPGQSISSFRKLAIADAYARLGNQQEATRLLGGLTDKTLDIPFAMDTVSFIVGAGVYNRMGRTREASDLLQRAYESAEELKTEDKAAAFTSIAEGYAQLGNVSMARRAANETGSDISRALALSKVLTLLHHPTASAEITP